MSFPQAHLRQLDSHLLKHCLQHVLFGDSLDSTVGEHRRTFASSLQEAGVSAGVSSERFSVLPAEGSSHSLGRA